MDTIKQFTNDYKHLTELGVTHTAFTNDATTTKVVKNVLIQSVGGKKSVDLMLDGKPIYRNLSVPANGTLKLENENLVVPPSSTLSYKGINASYPEQFRYTLTNPTNTFVDSNNNIHHFVLNQSDNSISHFMDNGVIYKITGFDGINSGFVMDAVESEDNVYFALVTNNDAAQFYHKIILINYSKKTKASSMPFISNNISPTTDATSGNDYGIRIVFDKTRGLFAICVNRWSQSSIDVLFVTDLASATPWTFGTTVSNTTLNCQFLNNGNLLILHGAHNYTVVKPDGTGTSGTLPSSPLPSSGHVPSLYVFSDNSFVVNAGSNIYKYSSSFTLLAISVDTYKTIAGITPTGKLICSNYAYDLVLLNDDLTINSTFIDYLPQEQYGAFDVQRNSTSGGFSMKNNDTYITSGKYHGGSSTDRVARRYYYDAMNIKIDGVEVTV